MGNKSDQIYIKYQAVMKKAEQLEELANELKIIAEKNVSGCNVSQSMWKGESGDTCDQKLRKMEATIKKHAQELMGTARALRKTAERQYQIEMALVALVSR